MIKRALLSVYDKEGIIDLAKSLSSSGVEIISSGGTYKTISEAGIPVVKVSDYTGSPEILDGRVKTLHPKIHGGILARRDLKEHIDTLKINEILEIDMVVGNLYPFEETIKSPNVDLQTVLENIDIGGPSMIRSAAKNYKDVVVLTDKNDYKLIIEKLEGDNEISLEVRKALAVKAFAHTAYYDTQITNYLDSQVFPDTLCLAANKYQELRYGENPHQKASVYKTDSSTSILSAKKLQGKELSYNNINDGDAALRMVLEFNRPTAIAVKHTNPCGAASADSILEAYKKAHDADPKSIFGGIVALNRPVDESLAIEMTKIFLDVIIAPGFTSEAKAVFAKKPNTRVLEVSMDSISLKSEVKSILGGYLVQNSDTLGIEDEDWKLVTNKELSNDQQADAEFAWKLIKHVKSNAIVVVKNEQTLGIGCGQVNRIDAAIYALNNGGSECKGALLASDGLFPFADVVVESARYGIEAIIQPGGSIRDNESIDAANEYDISMVFTGYRHFKH